MPKDSSTKKYVLVTALNLVITIAEFIGGALSGSLSLLSDAFHNLGDVGAIVLAFVAHLISKRQRNTSKTFGYERAETLAAFTNGVVLIVISLFLLGEAIQRFFNPEPVKGKLMLIIAVIGLAANVISMLVVVSQTGKNLNLRATFAHMMSDALSSVAVVVGAVILNFLDLPWLDPLLTLLVSLFILHEAWEITEKAANILMESNPNVDLEQVHQTILTFPQVENVHHVHLWRYSDDVVMLDAHINVDKNCRAAELEELNGQIAAVLKSKFGINHVTLQAECERGRNDRMIKPKGQED
ncbi:cation diffusion facilitator family transporter [Lactobacillus corticis]|uniref:Cation transporter n=1 Tax=Lactobacillus corticis TaxID=2201249 RepID=A0A916VIB1_9LACO|nr:cation diffusion facilitator family transporter [Lactobacillus corticis]GFZ27587.1 cation transporter [Lactobacillus corticis]